MGNCITSRTSSDSLVPASPAPFGGRRLWARSGQARPRDPGPRWARAAPRIPGGAMRTPQRISRIELLPPAVYGKEGQEEKIQEECGICLVALVCGDPIRSLPCKHVYHLDCIDGWLTRSFTCPYCWGPVAVLQPSSQATN
ncbi:RING finger protein 11-like [Hippopotamus amphibius kiboko]|uniref:RING finger protein 11-like n=1 Tax=Hippopotamus amphibius kiboko TaxID=575201 RepID=UPI00259830DB|nr:RING finger protein 11-like [Hippopotamus amphibius kiboko]